MSNQVQGKIINHVYLAADVYLMEILAPEIAHMAVPGQFVQVLCSRSYEPLLRRPISLHYIDGEKGQISLLYQVKGKGTRLLSTMPVNGEIDLIGPLGNGFTVRGQGKKVLIVGGGIGIAPLLPAAKELQLQGNQVTTILGFNSEKEVYRTSEFRAYAQKMLIVTRDGSLGEQGLVTEPLERELQSEVYNSVLACGPEAMLKAVCSLTQKYAVECQVSLEAYMACGIGACLGCTCGIKKGHEEILARVCTEGPVFPSKAVVWHE
ncbi:dihydroorotate dehydrogenase electron transfer subunit [Bacillota bacterium LX-D]|nr:dihydroorotate dehydrogenase electron transfer subunit [Bacillota bacterium LX-D]